MSPWFWVALAAPIIIYAALCIDSVWNWLLRRVPAECQVCGGVSDTLGNMCSSCRDFERHVAEAIALAMAHEDCPAVFPWLAGVEYHHPSGSCDACTVPPDFDVLAEFDRNRAKPEGGAA